MLQTTIYQTEAGGYGFIVEADDGSLRVQQDCKPEVEDIVLMSEAEATAEAAKVVAANTPAEA